MNIKRNIIFALEGRKKNGVPVVENVPIRMRVVFAGQRIEFTTGYRIDVAKWDLDKQKVKNGYTNKLKQSAGEINTDLLRQYTEIQNIFKEYEVHDLMPTIEQIKCAFNERIKRSSNEVKETEKEEPTLDFWKAFERFVAECGKLNNWTHATYEKFNAVKNHLREFDEGLSLKSFTESYLNDYMDFLQKKDMRNSTINKQMDYLKWFLRWCTKKGYCHNTAYEDFNPKLKSAPKKVIFLTNDELNKLKTVEYRTTSNIWNVCAMSFSSVASAAYVIRTCTT